MSFPERRDGPITTLINEHCELAENPLWRVADGCLCWTDITGGKLHRLQIREQHGRGNGLPISCGSRRTGRVSIPEASSNRLAAGACPWTAVASDSATPPFRMGCWRGRYIAPRSAPEEHSEGGVALSLPAAVQGPSFATRGYSFTETALIDTERRQVESFIATSAPSAAGTPGCCS